MKLVKSKIAFILFIILGASILPTIITCIQLTSHVLYNKNLNDNDYTLVEKTHTLLFILLCVLILYIPISIKNYYNMFNLNESKYILDNSINPHIVIYK